MKNNKKIIALISMVFVCTMLFVSISPAKAQFVLASWDFPDEYGQGIYGFFLQENSTGAWWTVPGAIILSTYDTEFEFEAGFALGLDVRILLNYTLLGLTHPDDKTLGLNYVRLNVTVTNAYETVFSQQNFTYDGLSGLYETGIWWYSQEVFFDFILTSGIYTATVTYEIFG